MCYKLKRKIAIMLSIAICVCTINTKLMVYAVPSDSDLSQLSQCTSQSSIPGSIEKNCLTTGSENNSDILKLATSSDADVSDDIQTGKDVLLATPSNSMFSISMPEFTYSDVVDGYKINIHAPEGVLPLNTVVEIKRIDSIGNKDFLEIAANRLNEGETLTACAAFNITFINDGIEIQPQDGSIQIEIQISDKVDHSNGTIARVIHIADENSVEDIQLDSFENDTVVYHATHLSVYGIVLAEANYIPIYTVEDLLSMNDTWAEYRLMNNLDLNGIQWKSKNIKNFDGGNNTIKNLYIDSYSHAISYDQESNFYFAGFLQSPKQVKNLNIENAFINVNILEVEKNPQIYVGIAAAQVESASNVNVKNSYINVRANEEGFAEIGGVIGWGTELERLSFEGELRVEGANYAGGIAGYVGSIIESTNSGMVAAAKCYSVGGIVGSSHGNIIECYNTGNVYNSINEKFFRGYAGGVVGSAIQQYGFPINFENLYNTGNIALASSDREGYAGGIAGFTQDVDLISCCYNVGEVNRGKQPDPYNHDETYDYPDETCGAVIGYLFMEREHENIYYCNDKLVPYERYAQFLHIEQMHDMENFRGFDFNSTWGMGDDSYPYPILQWQDDLPLGPEVPSQELDNRIRFKEDNWNFVNSPKYFTSTFEIGGYAEFIYDLSPSLKEQIIEAWFYREDKKDKKKKVVKWNGSCLGMTVTAILNKMNVLHSEYWDDPDSTQKAKYLYNLPEPKKSQKVLHLINFYQTVYNCLPELYFKNPSNEYERLKYIVDQVGAVEAGGVPILVSYGVNTGFNDEGKATGWAHAVAAYDYDHSQNAGYVINGKYFSHRINILDPNMKDPQYLYITSNFDDWHYTGLEDTKYNKKYIQRVQNDMDILNMINLETGKVNISNYSGRAMKFYSPDNSMVKISDDEGRFAEVKGMDITGTLMVSGGFVDSLANNTAGNSGVEIVLDEARTVTFENLNSTELNVSALYGGGKIAAFSSNNNSVVIDPAGKVLLQNNNGANDSYSLEVVLDEPETIGSPWYKFGVSGTNGAEVSLEITQEGVLLETDNMTDIAITASNDTDKEELVFSTDYDKVLIAPDPENYSLKPMIDIDFDGVFETSISDLPFSKEDDKSNLDESDDSGNDSNDTYKAIGKWVNDSVGWWYQFPDGHYPRNDWQYLDYNGIGKWYYFDNDGYMVVGWLDWNNRRYYLNPISNGWRGGMETGWILIENKWYYFSETGELLKNTVTPDGYMVDKDGVWRIE